MERSNATLYSVLRELSVRIGHVDALMAPGRKPLSFEALANRLVEIRAALAGHGIGRGDRVAVAMPNGPEMAACFLGVAACATFVPLNPALTRAEFAERFSQIRPKCLVVAEGGGNEARMAAADLGIGTIDLVTDTLAPAGDFQLCGTSGCDPVAPRWNEQEDIALILATSGSTARPKLVPLRLRHLINYAAMAREHYAIGPHDRLLHVMPMFHGHGLKSSMIVPILAGCGVVCVPRFSVDSFFKHLLEYDVTWYSAAYSIHRSIFDRIGDFREAAAASKLRFIRSGSGKLDPKVQRGLEEAFAAPMIERYGMSECGTLASNGFSPDARKQGSVGHSIGNTIAIMDEAGAIVGPNIDGEIVARGPSVFDGYLDDPGLNSASFVDGWFRTGDLGRIDEDGFLTVIGRVKDIINRGGEKISPAEIDAALAAHPDVGEGAAFGISHPTLGELVVAAVVAVPDADVDEQRIRQFLRSRLAPTKVPSKIYFVDRLPRSANGKLQRNRLPDCVASDQPKVPAGAVPVAG